MSEDWADKRAYDWLEHHMTGDDAPDLASLAALLREVFEQGYQSGRESTLSEPHILARG